MGGWLRITGGEKVRHRVRLPPTVKKGEVRPTLDRVRESLFGALQNRFEHARVADLFAGSGILGFESLSRGAEHCHFVEKDRVVARHIKKNSESLGFCGRTTICCERVESWLKAQPAGSLDLVFVDPPYAQSFEEGFWERMRRVVCPEGYVFVERPKKAEVEEPVGFKCEREQVFGDTMIRWWRRQIN